MTKQLHFTPEIQEALNHERYHHLSPLVQKRMETLWLKSHGLPHWQIAQLAGVCENTMRSYFALYRNFCAIRGRKASKVTKLNVVKER
jgi:hypothetical protein